MAFNQSQLGQQTVPEHDTPNPSKQTPLQTAVSGGYGASQYPVDPSMAAFRSRQPGPQPRLSAQAFAQQYGATHPATSAGFNGLEQAFRESGYQVERPTHAGNLPSGDKLRIDGLGRDFGSGLDNQIDPNIPGTWGYSEYSDAPQSNVLSPILMALRMQHQQQPQQGFNQQFTQQQLAGALAPISAGGLGSPLTAALSKYHGL